MSLHFLRRPRRFLLLLPPTRRLAPDAEAEVVEGEVVGDVGEEEAASSCSSSAMRTRKRFRAATALGRYLWFEKGQYGVLESNKKRLQKGDDARTGTFLCDRRAPARMYRFPSMAATASLRYPSSFSAASLLSRMVSGS